MNKIILLLFCLLPAQILAFDLSFKSNISKVINSDSSEIFSEIDSCNISKADSLSSFGNFNGACIQRISLEDCDPSFQIKNGDCQALNPALTNICEEGDLPWTCNSSPGRVIACSGPVNSLSQKVALDFDKNLCLNKGLSSCVVRVYDCNDYLIYEEKFIGECNSTTETIEDYSPSLEVQGTFCRKPSGIYTLNIDCENSECIYSLEVESANFEILESSCTENKPNYTFCGPNCKLYDVAVNIKNKSCFLKVKNTDSKDILLTSVEGDTETISFLTCYPPFPPKNEGCSPSKNSINSVIQAPAGIYISENSKDFFIRTVDNSIVDILQMKLSNNKYVLTPFMLGNFSGIKKFTLAAKDECSNEKCIDLIKMKIKYNNRIYTFSIPVVGGKIPKIADIAFAPYQSPEIVFNTEGIIHLRLKNNLNKKISVIGIRNNLPAGTFLTGGNFYKILEPEESINFFIVNWSNEPKTGKVIIYTSKDDSLECDLNKLRKLTEIKVRENTPEVCSRKVKNDRVKEAYLSPVIHFNKTESDINFISIREIDATLSNRDIFSEEFLNLIKQKSQKKEDTVSSSSVSLFSIGNLEELCK